MIIGERYTLAKDGLSTQGLSPHAWEIKLSMQDRVLARGVVMAKARFRYMTFRHMQ